MMKNATDYSRLLKILASVLEKLTEGEIRGFWRGN